MFFKNRNVPADAQLIRERRRLRRRRHARRIDLRAEQRPRAARKITPTCLLIRRHRRDRAAVSCEAGVTTRSIAGNPVSSARFGRSVPTTVPGGEIVPRIFVGRPSSPSISRAQSPVWQSTIWLVDAIVASTTRLPLSQK